MPRVFSELAYHVALLPKVEPPLTAAMTDFAAEALRLELRKLNVELEGHLFTDSHHVFTVSAPPDVAPVIIAHTARQGVSAALKGKFGELEGWGEVYHDRVFVKTGEPFSTDQIEEFITLSLEGL
ncbi:MAG: hypothetical protein HY804_04230 [Nitrospinae bacterium]|nr:hypothetical protein [Nitrospinota bacterium]